MISASEMPKKRSSERKVTDEDRKLVHDLTGQIIARMEEKKLTRKEVALKAGRKSASTLYGWRNGSSERPSLLDLQDFAAAVGLNVRLVDDSTYVADGSRVGTEDRLKPETAEVVRLMNDLPDEARAAIRDAAFKANAELLANPQEPGEEHERSPHARRR